MAGRVRAGLTRSEGRKFAFTVGSAFVVLSAIVLWRGHTTVATGIAGLGLVLLLAGIAVPGHLSGVYRAWMGMAHAISKVTTPIFMGIVYFLVILPTGVLRRTFGSNPLVRRETDGSYFVRREQGASRRSDLTRQF